MIQLHKNIVSSETLETLKEIVKEKSKTYVTSNTNMNQVIKTDGYEANKILRELVCNIATPTEIRDGKTYKYASITPGITYTQYSKGGNFHMHRDSPACPAEYTSLYTFLVYLTDDSTGSTVFYPDAVDVEPGLRQFSGDVIARIRETKPRHIAPSAGDAVLFDIRIPHESLPCSGDKMLVACKLMYDQIKN